MEEAMVLYRARFVQQLLGPVHEASAESCPGTIGHITLDAKQTGTRSAGNPDRKSTRLNSSHLGISYAAFCLKHKRPAFKAIRQGRSRRRAYLTFCTPTWV